MHALDDAHLPKCRKPAQIWEVCPDCAKAAIGDGLIAIVDLSDLPAVQGLRWSPLYRQENIYAQSGNLLMHRVIAGLKAQDGQRVDHRNNHGLDNRRENLRVASQSNNRANARKFAKTKSRFKGVTSQGRKWRAFAGPRSNRHYLGTFGTEEEAARAYDAKALELFGPFARLNFPSQQQAA